MTKDVIAQYPFDHAGIGETSLMMALCPEAVDMTRLNSEEWYSQSAKDASKDLGERGVELILAHMRAVLWG
jgi:creatinine amidohydrolase